MSDLLVFQEGVPEPESRYPDALVLATEVPYREFDNGVIWTTPSGKEFSIFIQGSDLAFSHPLLGDILMQAALFVKGHKLVLRPHHEPRVTASIAWCRCFWE